MKNIVLLTTLMCGLMFFAGCKKDENKSQTTGDCTWSITGVAGDYTLVVSGNGAMANYDYEQNETPWYQYRNDIKTIVIQDGVTTIGAAAFDECSNVRSVVIPNSVGVIGNHAFSDCHSLIAVDIPNSVNAIGNNAFYHCRNLMSITIPNSVNAIGKGAFYQCSNLISIVIPNSITIINEGTFFSSGLTSVTIPNSATVIDKYAFVNCADLTAVIIGSSVTTIGSAAFAYCNNLTAVINLSPAPQSIDRSVFSLNLNDCTLQTPANSLEAYMTAEIWNEFGNIIPIEN